MPEDISNLIAAARVEYVEDGLFSEVRVRGLVSDAPDELASVALEVTGVTGVVFDIGGASYRGLPAHLEITGNTYLAKFDPFTELASHQAQRSASA